MDLHQTHIDAKLALLTKLLGRLSNVMADGNHNSPVTVCLNNDPRVQIRVPLWLLVRSLRLEFMPNDYGSLGIVIPCLSGGA